MTAKSKCIAALAGLFLAAFSGMTAFAAQPEVSIRITTDTSEPVFQGELIPYRADIRVSGDVCWLRAIPGISVTGLEGFGPECLVPGENWVLRGGIFYLTVPAVPDTDYTAVTSFLIPDNNSDVAPGSKIDLSITAEAVSRRAFLPDFGSDDPWGNAADYPVSRATGGGGVIARPATGVHIYQEPQSGAAATYGTWVLKNRIFGIWGFRDVNGEYVKNGWIYTWNPYSATGSKADFFHFDAAGNMSVGWVDSPDGGWYYTQEVSDGGMGTLLYGWLSGLPDGNTYYALPGTGRIATGLLKIGEASYYFASEADGARSGRLYRMVENTGFGRWVTEKAGLRTIGSLYRNEQSPAGYAGEDGAIR